MEYHQKQVPREPRWQHVTVTGMMKATEMAVDPPEEIGIVRISVLLNFRITALHLLEFETFLRLSSKISFLENSLQFHFSCFPSQTLGIAKITSTGVSIHILHLISI